MRKEHWDVYTLGVGMGVGVGMGMGVGMYIAVGDGRRWGVACHSLGSRLHAGTHLMHALNALTSRPRTHTASTPEGNRLAAV